jgi:outer membrane lipoprotein SlyB
MNQPFYKLRSLMLAALLASSAVPAAFAAGELGSHELNSEQARQVMKVRKGVVIDIQKIELIVDASNNSKAVGGVLGALAGASATQGQNNWQMQGLGTAVGGVLGMAAAEKLTSSKKEGLQVVVQLDSGEAVALAQTMENPLAVGQRVFLIGEGKTVRAVPAQN